MKKIVKIVLLISLISLIGILSTKFVIKTLAETKYCGTTAECFVNEGSGTKTDPYQISTPEQLNAIRYNLSASYKLMNDIDLTYDTQDKNGLFYNEGMGWESIGTNQHDSYDGVPFTGVFDGNNHSIIGLYSNSTTLSYNGLFGYAKDATIKNLKLKNVNINNEADVGYMCATSASGRGGSTNKSSAGALVGTTKNSVIENIGVTGSVNAYQVGGIVGCAGYNTTVKNSYNAARIIGYDAGGISGDTNGATLENVYNVGDIGIRRASAGGITGGISYNSKILNAYNIGFVYGSGIVDASSGYASTNTISNVYNLGIVMDSNIVTRIYVDTTISNAYGIDIMSNEIDVDEEDNNIFQNYKLYSINSLKNANVYSGFDFNNVWEIDSTSGYNYPKLRGLEHIELAEDNNFTAGAGKVYDPYQITTSTQLNEIRNYKGRSFVLNNDIDLTYDTQNESGLFYNDGLGWEAIGTYDSEFIGIVDGNNHKIIGLSSNSSNYSSLFGKVTSSIISNIIMENVSINSSGSAAGLIGSAVKSNVSNITVNGNIKGNSTTGGIIGSVSDSSILTHLVNLSDISSNSQTGGLVGMLYGGSLTNSYNAGSVSASYYTGGLVGETANSPVISECYNVGQVISNRTRSGLVIGYARGGSVSNVYSLDFGKQMIGETSTGVTTYNMIITTPAELKNRETYSNWNNFDINYKIETINNITRFPVLTTNNTSYINEITTAEKVILKTNGKQQSTTIDYNVVTNGLSSDNVIIKSNDESIVSVDLDGKITAIAPGNTTIKIYGYDGYEVSIPVEVLEITYTSDKYDLSNDYIYVKTEQFDINEINVTNGTKIYEGYKLKILDDDYVVKEYDIVQVSSEKFDLSNEYIMLDKNYTIGDILATNGAVNLSNNRFNVTYYKTGEIIDYFYKSSFKEQNFYRCVVDTYNNQNNTSIAYSSHLTDEQLQTIQKLNCSGYYKNDDEKISRTEGLEKLINLNNLALNSNNISLIDLSKNTNLKYLNLSDNKLSSLNLESNTNLENILISQNSLSILKTTGLSKLVHLSANLNKLVIVDVSDSTNLQLLQLYDNKISNIDLSKNVNLSQLVMAQNQLKTIDLSNNKELQILELGGSCGYYKSNGSVSAMNCGGNNISEIDLSNNKKLFNLSISFNKLRVLDLTNNNLKKVEADVNGLNQVIFGDISKLETVSLIGNNLKEIALTGATNLERLELSDNDLTELNLENCPKLKFVQATNNNLSNINISDSVLLEELSLSANNLQNIDVSKNINLEKLLLGSECTRVENNTIVSGWCSLGNNINNIELSNNTKLKTLYLSYNNLETIDLSKNVLLEELNLENNKLKELDVSRNTVLNNIDLSNNSFIKNMNIYKGEQHLLESSITLPQSLLEGRYNGYQWYWKVLGGDSNLSLDSDKIIATKAGQVVIDGDFKKQLYLALEAKININILEATSDSYEINAEENYIYTKTDTNKDTILSNIKLNYGLSSIEDNKLLIKYDSELVKSFDVYNISFNSFKIFHNKILVMEGPTYEEFTSNINTNGVTYKIYNGDGEVTTGTIIPGMHINVYIGEELIDTYEITDEYVLINEILNVNETTSMIEDLTVGQTVEGIKENIDTTGIVKVVDQENNEVIDIVGTGYKVVIQLSKETIEYTLVVNGDITGDGEIKMSDVMKAATQMIEENTIVEDCYLKAADVTGDGKIRMSDVMKLANLVLEGGNN